MATDDKKIIVDSDRTRIQYLLPDCLQPPLDLVARSSKFPVVGNPRRVKWWKIGAIYLAAGRQRQIRDKSKPRRN